MNDAIISLRVIELLTVTYLETPQVWEMCDSRETWVRSQISKGKKKDYFSMEMNSIHPIDSIKVAQKTVNLT
ncbi:unnamed protein product [Bathycoccus prasinos]